MVAELLGLEIHTKTRQCVSGEGTFMETHVQLYKEGVYGGWQIYSRSRGPAALAWETEAMLTCTCHCPHQSIHSPHQSIHTRETKYQSSSSSASARVVSEVTTQANLHQGPMYQYDYGG